jgi:hypothetical protein
MSRDASAALAASKPRGESMGSNEECAVKREAVRPLTQGEIDLRIERLMADVAAGSGAGSPAPDATGATRPRRITARELTERVRPFLVYN